MRLTAAVGNIFSSIIKCGICAVKGKISFVYAVYYFGTVRIYENLAVFFPYGIG